jgi:hypothetical protein
MQGQILVLTKELRNKAKIEIEVEKKMGKLLGAGYWVTGREGSRDLPGFSRGNACGRRTWQSL